MKIYARLGCVLIQGGNLLCGRLQFPLFLRNGSELHPTALQLFIHRCALRYSCSFLIENEIIQILCFGTGLGLSLSVR